jgi:hypothetical protein
MGLPSIVTFPEIINVVHEKALAERIITKKIAQRNFKLFFIDNIYNSKSKTTITYKGIKVVFFLVFSKSRETCP